MKNKGFINPQLGLFILAGLLVVGGGVFAYKYVSSSNTVLGDATTLPAGIPKLNYKTIRVMETLKNESFTLAEPKYKGYPAKGYVFTAVSGQALSLTFKEGNGEYIKSYLFDKNGKLLKEAQSVIDLDDIGVNKNYTGNYYVVITNSSNMVQKYSAYLEDAWKIYPVIRVKDFQLGKVYNVTELQYINPNYVVPVKKGVLSVDYNKKFSYANPGYAIYFQVCSLPGTYSEHMGGDYSTWKRAENTAGATCKQVNGAQVSPDTLSFFNKQDTNPTLSYMTSIDLPSQSQISIDIGDDATDEDGVARYLRFWTQ